MMRRLSNGIGDDIRCVYLSNHGTFQMRLALVVTAVNVLMCLTLGSTSLADSREVKEAASILRGVWTAQGLSKEPGIYLIQIMMSEPFKETIRYEISIEGDK